METDWTNKRVVILGAARQGVALARWLDGAWRQGDAERSARRGRARFRAGKPCSGLPIQWALGGHPLELLDHADVLCLSGGVPMNLPIVEEAIQRGIPLSNDTQIFMEAVPCKTVGITGSAGKTTTTALVGEMATRALAERGQRTESGELATHDGPSSLCRRKHWGSADLIRGQMKPTDLAILEISSFQLEQMTLSPNVAAILNITPNHLDRHGTMEAYTAAKARILEFQSEEDIAVLGRDDPGAWELRDKVKGSCTPSASAGWMRRPKGTYYEDGMLYLSEHRVDIPLLRREQIQLRGRTT